MALTTHPHLAPRLKKGQNYTPSWPVSTTNFTFYITEMIMVLDKNRIQQPLGNSGRTGKGDVRVGAR
jgi:hypothetical protein